MEALFLIASVVVAVAVGIYGKVNKTGVFSELLECPTCNQSVSKEKYDEICAKAEAAADRVETATEAANYRGDAAVSNQLNFQTPATAIMEKIVDLHHDLMFFIIAIVVFVS